MTLLDRARHRVRLRPPFGSDRAATVDPARAHGRAGVGPIDTTGWLGRWGRLVGPGRRVVGFGAAAALGSWLGMLTLVTVGWAFTPQSGSGAGELAAVSAGLWLLATGGSVQVAGPPPMPVAIVPLLAWGLSLWLAAALLARARRHHDDESVLGLGGRFLAGYAAVVVALAALAAAGPIEPTGPGLLRGLLVPLGVLGHDLLRDPPPALADRLPPWLPRAWRPAGWGLAALGAAGLTLALGALVARRDTVSALYAAAGADGATAVLLTAAQLLFAPNLVLWAVSFLAGPGVQITAQGSVTVTGAAPGLVPLVPALGALPSEAVFGSWVRLALLVPVLVGVLIGRSADRQWARLSHWSGPARTAAAAVVLVAGAVGVLAWLGSGAAGTTRLAHVGPAALPLTAALLAQLGGGAAAYLGVRRLLARVVGWPRAGRGGTADAEATSEHPDVGPG